MPRQKKFFTDFRHLFTPVKGLFSPLPEVQCPTSFRYLESLGETKWKEVVSDCKTFAHKGSTIAAQKKEFFWRIMFFKN